MGAPAAAVRAEVGGIGRFVCLVASADLNADERSEGEEERGSRGEKKE
jgi:hypothetical protein